MTAGRRGGRGAQETLAGTALRPSRDANTELTPETTVRRLHVFLHEADALATRIAADCERMLRAVGPEHPAWRAAIGRALLAARHSASVCQVAPEQDEVLANRQLRGLEPAVRDALQPVVDAMGEIIRQVPVSLADELMVADARSVRAMATTAQSLTGRHAEHALGARQGAIDPAEPAGAAQPHATIAPATERILIVDDSPDILKLLGRMLTRMGYAVTPAVNGREALAAAAESPVDLVITDIDMPEMDGLALLEAIKASDALRHVPVIMVSGASDVARVARSLELGADDHISKPFQQPLLEARVRSSLYRKRLRDAELEHLRRVAQITAAAEAVDRNAYVPGALAGLAQGGDRLAHLARVFDRMVLHMRSREDRLRARLRQLSEEMSGVAPSRPSAAVESAESPYATGHVLAGRYEIVAEVGRGGMGVVYQAIDRELREDVAIKIVRSDLVRADTTLVDRLKSEIRLARKLTHPNVLRAFDLGEVDGTYYITMEYVRGVTLLEMLDQRGALSPDATVALGVQLADALAVAHAAQIIHRDIKPANLLVEAHGTLKVMDFGLAKVVASEGGHTQRGVAVGTPHYMAPEQLMGGDLDARADLFAVGVVLYECLTGRTPFDSSSPVALVAQMIDGDYPRLTDPDVPPRLAALIGTLLQMQPDDRIQTASDLSRRLAEIEPSAGPA